MGILCEETDSPGVVVVVWTSVVWGKMGGGGGAGVVFTMMERVGRETDLTTGFPNAENGGGEALVAVGRRVEARIGWKSWG